MSDVTSEISIEMKDTFGVNYVQVLNISVFNGGEVNIQLPEVVVCASEIFVDAKIRCSDGVMALILVKNALDNAVGKDIKVTLKLGYLPYARQDRICNKGEALSIQAFVGLINMLQFNEVMILDPHSEVGPALFTAKLSVTTQEQMLSESIRNFDLRLGADVITLVSPDAGATKKTEQVSKHYNGLPVIQATKKRDLKTGQLSGFGFYGDVKGKDLLIVDDICDGGGTFVGLAKILKEAGAGEIGLYVSHGIFSRGVDNLLENGIDYIITTDSFFEGYHKDVEVVKY